MRILSMTATFGKLEHETLSLEPGLNIVQAPNEWGKSTWCAFLVAMLYGIETRTKSTKNSLADKERYEPWSGSPMAGRIDLNWNGKNITIERQTKGRVPLGDFRAYETETGLAVPELTAANCGQTLLEIERSVFQRAGFIRFCDLPVTQDEALRTRLNALVTTGDETGDGERLEKGLKELKNRCRYHRTGLIPQAEAQRDSLEETCRELDSLQSQSEKLQSRLDQVNDWIAQLENHKDALRYAAAQEDAERVAQAWAARNEAAMRLEAAHAICREMPIRDQAEWAITKLRRLNQEYLDLQMESEMLPLPPEPEEPPEVFRGMTGNEAIAKAEVDSDRYSKFSKKKPLLLILGVVLIAVGGAAMLKVLLPGLIVCAAGVILTTIAIVQKISNKKKCRKLEDDYGSANPVEWVNQGIQFSDSLQESEIAMEAYRKAKEDLNRRLLQLRGKIKRCTQGQDMESYLRSLEKVIVAWDDWADAQREFRKVESYLKTLKSMAKTAEKPKHPDFLTYTGEETARILSDAMSERNLLQDRLSQYAGRSEALGKREAVQSRIDQINQRIAKLEDVYAALTIAQQTLQEASMELQRRFSPKITKRAQKLMGILTGGRYNRLRLGEDFTLKAGAEQEDTLREALWRSDGTIDQLYLALRLAVAEELSMDAPLVLDDALVRFDDDRLAAAMEVLRKEAEKKQVILFTCQSREKNMEA